MDKNAECLNCKQFLSFWYLTCYNRPLRTCWNSPRKFWVVGEKRQKSWPTSRSSHLLSFLVFVIPGTSRPHKVNTSFGIVGVPSQPGKSVSFFPVREFEKNASNQGKVREFDLPKTCLCGFFIFTATKVHCNLEGPFELEISWKNYHGISKKFIMEKSGKNQGILFSRNAGNPV